MFNDFRTDLGKEINVTLTSILHEQSVKYEDKDFLSYFYLTKGETIRPIILGAQVIGMPQNSTVKNLFVSLFS